jgi:hypothetical protein
VLNLKEGVEGWEGMETLPPHPIVAEAAEYIEQMTAAQKELHVLAQEKLGSSYFVERTKGFLEWKAKQKVVLR